MKAGQKHFGIMVLLLSCAAAENNSVPVKVQKISARPETSDLRVEITLSAPVNPSVETAQKPDRILLDFPGTTPGGNPPTMSVNANGVRRIRTQQHSTNPLTTRVVLDVDQAREYTVKAEGNVVIVIVGA